MSQYRNEQPHLLRPRLIRDLSESLRQTDEGRRMGEGGRRQIVALAVDLVLSVETARDDR